MIKGKVINTRTRKPIQDANVYYTEDASGKLPLNQIGTITDARGEYYLSDSDLPFITVSHIEYKGQTKNIQQTYGQLDASYMPLPTQRHEINFFLEPDIKMLKMVTITGKMPGIWEKHRNIIMIAAILLIGACYVYLRERKVV